MYDEDIAAIVEGEMFRVPQTFTLEYLHISSGTGTIPTATVKVRRGEEVVQEAAWGDGPVDAAYKAIKRATGMEDVKLSDYAIRSVTSGTEALGEVTVRLEAEGRKVVGRGTSTDIIEASVLAFLDGLNKFVALPRER